MSDVARAACRLRSERATPSTPPLCTCCPHFLPPQVEEPETEAFLPTCQTNCILPANCILRAPSPLSAGARRSSLDEKDRERKSGKAAQWDRKQEVLRGGWAGQSRVEPSCPLAVPGWGGGSLTAACRGLAERRSAWMYTSRLEAEPHNLCCPAIITHNMSRSLTA